MDALLFDMILLLIATNAICLYLNLTKD